MTKKSIRMPHAETVAVTLDEPRVVARPDGYYWLADDGRQEFGPFESAAAATADLRQAEENAPEPGETLAEAEDEVGINDFIDPDTGTPAEDATPRIEQH